MLVAAPKSPVVTVLREDPLLALFANAGVTAFPKNTVIINEGDRTNLVYLIRSGRVKVFLRSEDGKKVDINVLEAGDCFGEMTIDGGPRSASVVTMAASQLSIIPQSAFKDFVVRKPEFALQIILKLILRTRELLNNVKSLALLDVYGRVARTLRELATRQDDCLIIKEKLSAQDIAHRIGTSRESVSRILRDLIRRNYILMDGKSITIIKELPRHL